MPRQLYFRHFGPLSGPFKPDINICYIIIVVVLVDFQIDGYGLKLENEGFYNGYDSSVDPSIANSFATAALRFGHTQIRDLMSRYSSMYYRKKASVRTDDYFDPAPSYGVSQGGIACGLIRGLVKDHSQKVDV